MTRFRRSLLGAAMAVLTVATGCDKHANPSAAAAAKVDRAAIERANKQVSQPAWLRDRLPEHTAAYMRIPSLWGLLSAPDGRPLDIAYANDAHVQAIAKLRKAVAADPTIAGGGAGPALELLLGDQGGPIEVAVVDPSDGVTPFSHALITTVLDLPDVAALNARLVALSHGDSPLQAPIDANGDALLKQAGALHFDVATHRLFLEFGTTASALTLQQDLKQAASTRAHPMQESEREIDASGQGLFAWMSTKGLDATLAERLADLPRDSLLPDALAHMQSIALGWGTVDGRGRLQLQVRAPGSRLLAYLAPNAGDVAVKSSGKPSWVATMATIGPDNAKAIVDGLDRDFAPGARARYDEIAAMMKTQLGVEPFAFAGLLGPLTVLWSDANGRFVSVHVRDRKALYAKLDELTGRFAWRNEVLHMGGIEIHHVHIPGMKLPPRPDGKTEPGAELFSRMGSHLYWTEEGDDLVFANVPQRLVDRAASKPATAISAWLHDAQSYDAAHTLVGVAATTHNMQREVYYTYLNALQAIGDLLGQPVDLAQLPNAGQLQLAVEGASGMALIANDQRIALQVTYEQSPLEGVIGGENSTMATVAVVAILAAIAIPAYQDYVIRSQVAEGAALSAGAKTAVAEYYANYGRMPVGNSEAGMATPSSISGNYVQSVSIANGRISVVYGGRANTKLAGAVLVFSPNPGQGQITWTCDSTAGTTVEVKYRPTLCRP